MDRMVIVRLDIIVQKGAHHLLVSRLIVSNSLIRRGKNTQHVLLVASAAVTKDIGVQKDLQHQEDNPYRSLIQLNWHFLMRKQPARGFLGSLIWIVSI